jgi:hypothetical protein
MRRFAHSASRVALGPALVSGLALPLLLSGCPSDPAPVVDAALPDARVFAASELYGPCEIDAQCPGEGAVCRRPSDGFPGGYCTVPCDDRTPCGGFGTQNNHCVQLVGEDRAYCQLNCLNGIDCRDEAYTCLADQLPTGGLCIPVCSSDAQCGGGTVCDPFTARCVAPGSVSTGAVTGEPCASNAACASGACVPEANGFLGGYCIANCALPAGWNTNTFFDGPSLPNGGCAGDAVCFPNGSITPRDLGVCLDQCTSDGDCRDGYECRRQFQLRQGGPTFSYENGVCLPVR